MGAPLAVALGALHYLALFLQLGGATRPAGHAPWDNHVSGHGEFGRHPADFPIKPHARPRRSYLASPGLEPSRPWRASRGAPCRVHGATLAPWPLLRRAPLVHPDPTLTGKPLPTHTFVRIPHLHDHTAIHRHCHTKSHTTCFLTLTTPTSHISRHLFTTPSTLINTHTYAHYRHIRHCGWWALTLPAGTLAHTLHNSCLPACPQTHGQHTHTCIHL